MSKQQPYYILGIESSCDDTSAAVLAFHADGTVEVVAQKTASQIDIHKAYGGVVPELAGRKHAENIMPVIEEVLTEANSSKPIANSKKFIPDAIAVTAGPGLLTGLLVGVETAKTLSYLWNVPLVRVNHIEGHIYSVLLASQKTDTVQFPALCLIVSGGHTELILMKDHGVYELIGKTRDDAAGECFDKVAKLLDLEYPGGPKISALAKTGRTDAIAFPRPMLKEPNYDFSFAGLKTSALYWLRDNKLSVTNGFTSFLPNLLGHFGMSAPPITREDFCASFETAIVDVLTRKTLKAIKQYKPKTVILAGGVSANEVLRQSLQSSISSLNSEIQFLTCPREYSMDNAAMIAMAGYAHVQKNDFSSWDTITPDPNWHIYT
jgi:N6-L-threonylcarbamoyladenine synthase